VNTTDFERGTPVNTVRHLVANVSRLLDSEPEAKWIVAQGTGVDPGKLLTVLDLPVSKADVVAVSEMVGRRQSGEPLQYVLGTWSFRELEVHVDPRALVPRPETEQVVEVALGELRRLLHLRGHDAPVVTADLGTGSGVIALSLALEGGSDDRPRPSSSRSFTSADDDVQVWATDASSPALQLARTNLDLLAGSHPTAAARVRLAEGSWFEALPPHLAGHVDLVVSNPPYVSATEWSALDPEVRDYEPRPALVSGDTGFEALEFLVDEGRRWLSPAGALVLELAPHQAAAMSALATAAGYVNVGVRLDLAGRARTLVASRPDA
jgi:release factor glutamine methyltransferase